MRLFRSLLSAPACVTRLGLRCASLGLALLGVAARAQSPAPSVVTPERQPVGELRGTVVDGVSGKPVARVLVTSADRRMATMTNNDGRFTLPFAPPGGGVLPAMSQVFLNLQRPGYLSPEGPVSVTLPGAAGGTRLKLMPAAAVAGRAFALGNDSPQGVNVVLLARIVNNGERRWATASAQRTGRDGSFHFGDLHPGEYTVMTTEWRGDQPSLPAETAVTEQYPPVFFGDAPTLAAATLLHLHYGDAAQTDLHLRLARYYPVTVPIAGPPSQGVNVQIGAADLPTGYALGFDQRRHAVAGALPNGDYSLYLTSYGVEQAFGSFNLHVGGAPVHTAPVVLSVPAPIAVRVHREFTGAQQPEHPFARVYLEPQGGAGPFVTANTPPGHEDDLTLTGAAPGRYTVHVEPSFGYPASVRSGSLDLLAEPLTVSAAGAPAPIDVTLRDDAATVSGTIATEDSPLPQPVFVVLLPVSPGAQFVLAGAGPDGSFRMPNVVPGDYRLLAATHSPWQLPWRDRDAMRPLEAKAVPVSVAAGGVVEIKAPLIDDTQLDSAASDGSVSNMAPGEVP